jgi:hypothetical protein
MNELFMKKNNEPLDLKGDEDYLYEQYLQQQNLNEQYWSEVNSGSIFPDEMEYDDEYYKSNYLPTPEEEQENFKQIKK